MTEFMASPALLEGVLGKPSNHAFSLAQQSGKSGESNPSRDVMFAIDPTQEVRNADGLTGEIAFDEPVEWVPSWDSGAQVEEVVAAEKAMFIATTGGTPLSASSARSSFSDQSDDDQGGPHYGNSSYPPDKVSPRTASPVAALGSPQQQPHRHRTATPPLKEVVLRDTGFMPPVDLKGIMMASPLKDKYLDSAPAALKAVPVSQITLQASRSMDNLGGKFFADGLSDFRQAASESKSVGDVRFMTTPERPHSPATGRDADTGGSATRTHRTMERSASGGGARRQVSFMDEDLRRVSFEDERRRIEEERRLNFEDERRRMEQERRIIEENTIKYQAMRQADEDRRKKEDDDRRRQAEAHLMSAEADALVREVMTLGLGDDSPKRKDSADIFHAPHHQHQQQSLPLPQIPFPSSGGSFHAPAPSPQQHSAPHNHYVPGSPMQAPTQSMSVPSSPYGQTSAAFSAHSPPRSTYQHGGHSSFPGSPVSQYNPPPPAPQASPMRSNLQRSMSTPHWNSPTPASTGYDRQTSEYYSPHQPQQQATSDYYSPHQPQQQGTSDYYSPHQPPPSSQYDQQQQPPPLPSRYDHQPAPTQYDQPQYDQPQYEAPRHAHHQQHQQQQPQRQPLPEATPPPSPYRDYRPQQQSNDDQHLMPPPTSGRTLQRSMSSPMYTHEFPPPIHGYSQHGDYSGAASPSPAHHNYAHPPTHSDYAQQSPAKAAYAPHPADYPQQSPSKPPYAPPHDYHHPSQPAYPQEPRHHDLPRSLSFGGHPPPMPDHAESLAPPLDLGVGSRVDAVPGTAEHTPQAAEIAEMYRQMRLQEGQSVPPQQAAAVAEQYRLQRMEARQAEYTPSAAEVAEKYRQKKREEEARLAAMQPPVPQAAEVAEMFRQRRLEEQAKGAATAVPPPGYAPAPGAAAYKPQPSRSMGAHMNPHQMKQLRRRELEMQAHRYPDAKADDRHRYQKKADDRLPGTSERTSDLFQDPALLAADRESVQKLIELKQQQLALQQQQLELERKLQQQLQEEEQRKRLESSASGGPVRLTSEHRSSSALNPHAPGFEPSGLPVPPLVVTTGGGVAPAPADAPAAAVPAPVEAPTEAFIAPPRPLSPAPPAPAAMPAAAPTEHPLPPVYPPSPSRGFADPPRSQDSPTRGYAAYGAEPGYGGYDANPAGGRGYQESFGGRPAPGYRPPYEHAPGVVLRPNGAVAPPGYNGSRYVQPRYGNAQYRR